MSFVLGGRSTTCLAALIVLLGAASPALAQPQANPKHHCDAGVPNGCPNQHLRPGPMVNGAALRLGAADVPTGNSTGKRHHVSGVTVTKATAGASPALFQHSQ